MAERRMFAKTIIDSDNFLDMPMSAQCLYFHLSMRADDEGFINNPKKITKMIGAADDDLKLLILKNFVIAFDTGVIVIKHWKIHNYIQSDRFKATVCQEERKSLTVKSNVYNLDTKCIQDVSTLDTQVRLELGKDSIELGKDSIDFGNNKVLLNNKDNGYINSLSPHTAERESEKETKIPPGIDDVKAYIKEKGYDIDAEEWWYFYDSKGWKIGKEKMKKWKSAVNTWYFARKNKAQSPPKQETWAEQQRRLHEKFAREDEENAKRNEQRGN